MGSSFLLLIFRQSLVYVFDPIIDQQSENWDKWCKAHVYEKGGAQLEWMLFFNVLGL